MKNALFPIAALLGLSLCSAGASDPPDGQEPEAESGRIRPEQAVSLALNDISLVEGGVRLAQRDHGIEFLPEGIVVKPERGPTWSWRLKHIGVGDGQASLELESIPVPARRTGPDVISYDRDLVEEQYVVGERSVEQRFVIHSDPGLGGKDLVIDGTVACAGRFSETRSGWSWSDESGRVVLGTVTVLDADGRELPASMEVDARRTRIRVDGAALLSAAYPVVVDPEIGSNDFRISDMGPNGDTTLDARRPDVVYNGLHDEFLVVWEGDDADDGDFEIFRQRIDASTGAEVGANDARISDMGAPGELSYTATRPAVAYNGFDDVYLVVWEGTNDDNPNDQEIFGQLLDGATGAEIGTNDFRISYMGTNGLSFFDAFEPDVAFNGVFSDPQFLVVWWGDDDEGDLIQGDYEIFGRRLDGATAAGLGAGTHFRISDMEGTGSPGEADSPALRANTQDQEYLVVWSGIETTPAGSFEYEIYGQRLDALTGAELGTNDFRISDMGPDGSSSYSAREPALAYDYSANEYLVVWMGDDDTAPLGEGEEEIFGQFLDADGTELGTNDFRISSMGYDGFTDTDANAPAVAYSPSDDEYLVVWHGNVTWEEDEIYGQLIDATTRAEVGEDDFRISDMGPDDDTTFDGSYPSVRWSPTRLLVVWEGDDDSAPLVEGEEEIFGQAIVSGTSCPASITWLTSPANVPGSIGTSGLPTIGNTAFRLLLDDPSDSCGIVPNALAFVVVSATPAAGVFIPGYGCGGGPGELFLIPNNPALGPDAWGGPGSPAMFDLPIPNSPGLCGAQVLAQGAFAGGGKITLSEGLLMVLGW